MECKTKSKFCTTVAPYLNSLLINSLYTIQKMFSVWIYLSRALLYPDSILLDQTLNYKIQTSNLIWQSYTELNRESYAHKCVLSPMHLILFAYPATILTMATPAPLAATRRSNFQGPRITDVTKAFKISSFTLAL
jgi:hypothetical protein